jgi:hypothetical protein
MRLRAVAGLVALVATGAAGASAYRAAGDPPSSAGSAGPVMAEAAATPPPCGSSCAADERTAGQMAEAYGWTGRQAACLDALWRDVSGFGPYYEQGLSGLFGIPGLNSGYTDLITPPDYPYWSSPSDPAEWKRLHDSGAAADAKLRAEGADPGGLLPVWPDSPPPVAQVIRVQIRTGLEFIRLRYGTPCAAYRFYKKHGWYA